MVLAVGADCGTKSSGSSANRLLLLETVDGLADVITFTGLASNAGSAAGSCVNSHKALYRLLLLEGLADVIAFKPLITGLVQ